MKGRLAIGGVTARERELYPRDDRVFNPRARRIFRISPAARAALRGPRGVKWSPPLGGVHRLADASIMRPPVGRAVASTKW